MVSLSKSDEPLARNRDPNVTKNEHVYAICSQPEVVVDVISGEDSDTFCEYVCDVWCVDDDRPIWNTIFGTKEQKCLIDY